MIAELHVFRNSCYICVLVAWPVHGPARLVMFADFAEMLRASRAASRNAGPSAFEIGPVPLRDLGAEAGPSPGCDGQGNIVA